MPLNPPITNWSRHRVWIIGASSGIGAALAQALLERGARVALSARTESKLREVAGSEPNALVLKADITATTELAAAYQTLTATWGGADLIVFMAGTYFPVRAWELTAEKARSTLDTNLLGVMNGLALVLPDFIARGSGGLAVVSSVAGYRGLPKSLLYGPSKAALINMAETLYLDCQPRGLAVYVINPGFVKTSLTAQNDFKMPYLITPEQAANSILAGFAAGEFEIHFPKAFTRQLRFLRLLPYGLYFKIIRRATGL